MAVDVRAGWPSTCLKNLFLAFLAWRQTRFAFGVQTQLSQRLFTAYLRQPYTFHLQRNSAQLIRNVIGEVGMFTEVLMAAIMHRLPRRWCSSASRPCCSWSSRSVR